MDDVLAKARIAREAGASRFCMGAAWREVRDGQEFDNVVEMVRGVRAMGMEACVTLGMLKEHQAKRLADAGFTAYNHNLDTGPEFYGEIISTRCYEDRLVTLKHACARPGLPYAAAASSAWAKAPMTAPQCCKFWRR